MEDVLRIAVIAPSLAIMVATTIACSGRSGEGSTSSRAGVTGSSSPAEAPPQPFVRTCESSVLGELGPGWRRDELSAGPVVFVAAASYEDDPPGGFTARGDRGTVKKVLVVVFGDRPVEVSVGHVDAALAYDPRRWGPRSGMRFEAGDPRVRFEPCGGGPRSTQFNGGFLLRRPACVPVGVRVDGAGSASVTLSFGAGECG